MVEEDLKKIDPNTIEIVWKIMEMTRKKTIEDFPLHETAPKTKKWLKKLDDKYDCLTDKYEKLERNQVQINKALFGDKQLNEIGMIKQVDAVYKIFTGATFMKKTITWGVGITGACIGLIFTIAKFIKWISK